MGDVFLAAESSDSDRFRVYLMDEIFMRTGNDWWPLTAVHKNVDTAGHIVHELFHIAGVDHPNANGYDFDTGNDSIHSHCKLPNTNW